jgi:hypothetical protein
MVCISSSLASRQKSIPAPVEQKDLVHCEHDDDADRLPVESERKKSACREELSSVCCGPSATIVLFLKQVHLQKVVAAGKTSQQRILSVAR